MEEKSFRMTDEHKKRLLEANSTPSQRAVDCWDENGKLIYVYVEV